MDSVGLFNAIASHAAETGLFEKVNIHEPKNAPGNGLTVNVWLATLSVIGTSGLDAISVRVVFNVRIMVNMLREPQDTIDVDMLAAVDALLALYAGDFELGGGLSVRSIDLLGATGDPLAVRFGYLSQDGKLYRIADITLPVIINDARPEVA